MFDPLYLLSLVFVSAGILAMVTFVAYTLVFRWFQKYTFDDGRFKVILFNRIVTWSSPLSDIEEIYIFDYFAPSLNQPFFPRNEANRLATRVVVLKIQRAKNSWSFLPRQDIIITPRDPEDFVRRFNDLKALQ